MFPRKRRKLGIAFSDEVTRIARPFRGKKIKAENLGWEDQFLPNYQEGYNFQSVSLWRLISLSCIFLFIFFGLFLRLFHLQVIQGDENRVRADSNRIQMKVIHAPRGVIYDRNSKILAQNSPGFRLEKQFTAKQEVVFISRDNALLMEAKSDPNFANLEIDNVRSYPYGEVTAHVLGYTGQISAEELKDPQYSNYKPGDWIGRSGIEEVYENVLRGKDGAEIIEVDASGHKLRTLRTTDPIPGKNIYLALDVDLQKASFQALRDGVQKASSCCGAVVAEDPKTGEVLSLVSYPSYDPNAFTDPTRNKEVGGLFVDQNSPMLNRVIGGVYPPGSTFKITTALAGLTSGKISSQTQFEDTGVMNLGPYTFANWYFTQYGQKEGMVDLVKALQRSNDIFFYKAGEAMGEKVLGETAQKIGFGKKLGIDLPGEMDGLIPDNAWKQKNTGEAWYPGDTLHFAIGQGFLLATPLQVLSQTAFVADNGALIVPHLITKITDQAGSVIKTYNYQPLVKNIFNQKDVDLVKQGLSQVPKNGGTAWPFFAFQIATAGKTGTAEFGHPQNKTHAWYTSYAPEDNPEVVLTVLVEAGGEGSSVSAPIAKDIYTWYFNPDKNNLESLDSGLVATDSAKKLGE